MAEAPKAFVCGHPIAHSRSPLIHGYWLRHHGLNGTYQALDVAPNDFAAFLSSLRANGYVGGNVTIPNKEQAFALVAQRDEAAEQIGAVNTLWFEGGELWGGNTDAYGFAANLDAKAPAWDNGKTALILGAGGASRAIIHALKSRGFIDIRVANRTISRAQELADHFGKTVSAHALEATSALLGDADLVVNTSALGMHGEGDVAVDVSGLPPHAVVTDIVYVPLETPLLAAARHAGLKTVDGLGMLLHQAVPGFERWFGIRPEVTEALHDLIAQDLDKHR
ncbi:shikimate dehydrogenase [Oryzicola mucosus]|uniref:Shikimate dehydrogenase (NADP(+)) n=1 Tax=Oryzicola mucosus TaxID=2767425 RepID=A0A8J6PRQ7_9HYPH|nr:shikimate dehydrogenase [Oryzicola mucosus]MBD0413759.1 shikimate dehydrogenase [Oryzicola mucosus]